MSSAVVDQTNEPICNGKMIIFHLMQYFDANSNRVLLSIMISELVPFLQVDRHLTTRFFAADRCIHAVPLSINAVRKVLIPLSKVSFASIYHLKELSSSSQALSLSESWFIALIQIGIQLLGFIYGSRKLHYAMVTALLHP